MPDVQRERKARSGLSTATKSAIVIAVFVLIGATFYFENRRSSKQASQESPAARVSTVKVGGESPRASLPRLVELGADRCVPCKLMAPILEELRKEYAGTLQIESIDVWKNPDAAKEYGIRVIPTQIFYGASGKELFRHVGFLSKEDILAKLKDLGITIEKARNSEKSP